MSDPYSTAIDREIFADDVERYLQLLAEIHPSGLGDPRDTMPGLFRRPPGMSVPPNAAYLAARSALGDLS